jgi:hypothetical protein
VVLKTIFESILSGIRLGVYTMGNSTVGKENQDNDLITGNQRKKRKKNCDNDPGRQVMIVVSHLLN